VLEKKSVPRKSKKFRLVGALASKNDRSTSISIGSLVSGTAGSASSGADSIWGRFLGLPMGFWGE